MTIFGLYSEGESINGWKFKTYSKKMFTNKQNAENYILIFEKSCHDDTNFDAAVEGTLKTKIIEFDLI